MKGCVGIFTILLVAAVVAAAAAPILGTLMGGVLALYVFLAVVGYLFREDAKERQAHFYPPPASRSNSPRRPVKPLHRYRCGAGVHSAILLAESEQDARFAYAKQYTGLVEVVWVETIPDGVHGEWS